MKWSDVSNISSVLTIIGAFFSGLSWYKTGKYYDKIAKNINLEKLSSLDKNLKDTRNLYDEIKISKRGKSLQKIINNHLTIQSNLAEIRRIIPSKFVDILKSIDNANDQLNKINDENKHLEKNEYLGL